MEIKVRAWDIAKKKFHYPKLWDNTMPSNWEQHYILNLYTGLKDENNKGKDIYDGDIFEAIFSNTPNGYNIIGMEKTLISIKAVVVFIFGGFHVEMMHPTENQLVYIELSNFIKNEQKVVIGNRFQNPELLQP